MQVIIHIDEHAIEELKDVIGEEDEEQAILQAILFACDEY